MMGSVLKYTMVIALLLGVYQSVTFFFPQMKEVVTPATEEKVQEKEAEQVATETVQKTAVQVQTKALLEDVPLIQQMPELARGCEVTSLAMLLGHAGVSADKMTLAEQIVKEPFREGGLRGNPNEGFVGDMYTFDNSGYGVYHEPVAELAEAYLPGRIRNLTGQTFTEVLQSLNEGSPVWVITNATFAPLADSAFSTWETAEGTVKITYREHSVVIVGYDENYVYINDPLQADAAIPKERQAFEQAWIQMGSQAISYLTDTSIAKKDA